MRMGKAVGRVGGLRGGATERTRRRDSPGNRKGGAHHETQIAAGKRQTPQGGAQPASADGTGPAPRAEGSTSGLARLIRAPRGRRDGWPSLPVARGGVEGRKRWKRRFPIQPGIFRASCPGALCPMIADRRTRRPGAGGSLKSLATQDSGGSPERRVGRPKCSPSRPCSGSLRGSWDGNARPEELRPG